MLNSNQGCMNQFPMAAPPKESAAEALRRELDETLSTVSAKQKRLLELPHVKAKLEEEIPELQKKIEAMRAALEVLDPWWK